MIKSLLKFKVLKYKILMSTFSPLNSLKQNNETSTLTVDSKLASRLGFSPKEYSHLLDSHTSYEPVLEQVFTKVKGSSFKRDQSRIFKLFEQCIAYYKPNSTTPIGEIPLAQIDDIDTYRETSIRGRHFLKLTLGTQKFNLTCESVETIKDWANKIADLKLKITNSSYFINSKNKIVACKTSDQFWKKKAKDELEFEKDGKIISNVADLYAYEEVSESCEKWPSKSLDYIISGITLNKQLNDKHKHKEEYVKKTNSKLKYNAQKIRIEKSIGVFNRNGEVLKASVEGSPNFLFIFSTHCLKEFKKNTASIQTKQHFEKESLLGTIGTYYYNHIDRVIEIKSNTFIITYQIGMVNLKDLIKKFKVVPDFLMFHIINSLITLIDECKEQEINVPLFNLKNVYLKINKKENTYLSKVVGVNIFNINDFIYSETLKENSEFLEYPKLLLKILLKMATGKSLNKNETEINVSNKTSNDVVDLLNCIGNINNENDWNKLKDFKLLKQRISFEDKKENEIIRYLYDKK